MTNVLPHREFDSHRREELAWAAGFFDGEGCIAFKTTRVKRAGSFPKYAQLTVAQSGQLDNCPDVLLRFQRAILPVSSIIDGPYVPNILHKPKWVLRMSSFECVQATIAMLWQWLGPVKREQASRILSGVNYVGYPPKQTHCKRNHEIVIMGRDSDGSCKECRRIRNREYKAQRRLK